MFSFNNPYGACPTCTGLGMQLKADPDLIIPDDSLSILDGAITASGWNYIQLRRHLPDVLRGPGQEISVLTSTPRCGSCRRTCWTVILYGTGGEKLELHYDQPRGKGALYQPFEGVVNNLERRYQETQSDAMQAGDRGVHVPVPLPGLPAASRLKPEALAVTVGGMSIWQATASMPVDRGAGLLRTA